MRVRDAVRVLTSGRRNRKSALLSAVIGIGLWSGAVRSASADTYNWQDGQINWSDPHSWTADGSAAPGGSDIASFNLSTSNAPIIDQAALSVGEIWLSGSGAVTIGGSNALTLNGVGGVGLQLDSGAGPLTINAGLILGGDQRWVNNSGSMFTVGGPVSGGGYGLTIGGSGNTTIDGAIDGAGGVTKTGAGTVKLTANSSYGGGTTVSAGTLNIWNDANLGASSGILTLSGGRLQTSMMALNRTVNVSSASTIDVPLNCTTYICGPQGGAGALTGSGTLTKTGGGTLSLNNGAANSFSGDITLTIGGGTFEIRAANTTLPNLTSANTITINPGAILNIEDLAGGYVADRLGSSGNRPAVSLAGGAVYLDGASASYTQTLGALTLISGSSAISAITPSTGTPQLVFSSVTPALGATANLSVGSSDARIIISGQASTSFLGAWAHNGNNWVSYGSYGVRALSQLGGIIQGGSGDVYATVAQAIASSNTINSLNWAANGNLAVGADNLTITSGGIINQANNPVSFTGTGCITAGTGAAGTVPLTIYQNTWQTLTVSTQIQDNGLTHVALVKDGMSNVSAATVLVNSAAGNTYSGGTFVNTGVLQTGTTNNVRYLGTGAVSVNNGWLTLGAAGATAFSGSPANPTYTAINAGQITLPNAAPAGNEYFKIDSTSILVVSGATGAAGLDLATNLNAAPGAVLAESATGYLANIRRGGVALSAGGLTTPTYFFGLSGASWISENNLQVGPGTPWLGISTDRSAQTFNAAGNTLIAKGDFSLQALMPPGAALPTYQTLALGGGSISTPPNTPVNANIIGHVRIVAAATSYGTTATAPLTFQVTPGATLTLETAAAMGGGAGIANAVVRNGGTLDIGHAGAINGNVALESGGRLLASQSAGLTGAGTLTFNNGSILDITSATGFSGSQASSAVLKPGTIVRMHTTDLGTGTTPLDTFLGGKAGVTGVIYEVCSNNGWPVNPTVAGTTILTLNAADDGMGGVLTTCGYYITIAANGRIVIGANGGTIAATTGARFWLPQAISMGANTLYIGCNGAIDSLPKSGTVALSGASGAITASAGAKINVINGTLQIGADNALPQTVAVDLAASTTLDMAYAQSITKVTGSGTITGANALSLTDNSDYTFIPSIRASSGFSLNQNGSGVLTLAGGISGSGTLAAAGGTVRLQSGVDLGTGFALASNATGAGVTATFDLNGTSQTAYSLSLGGTTATSTPRIIGAGSTLTLAGGIQYTAANNPLGGIVSVSALVLPSGNHNFVVEHSASAAADLIVSSAIQGPGGIVKKQAGTLVLSGTDSYTGSTTVSAGTLSITGTLGNTLVTVNGGTLSLQNAGAISRYTLTLAGGTLIETVDGALTGTAGLTISASDVVLDRPHSYSGGTNLSGGSLKLSAAGAISAGTVSITGGTFAETVNNAISGTAAFTVSNSAANVTLSRSNNYTGKTTISAGTLNVTGTLGNTPVTVSGSTLNLLNAGAISQNTLTVGGGGTLVEAVNNALSGSAGLTVSGSNVVLDRPHSYTGKTTLSGGSLTLSIPGAISAGTLVIRGGTFTQTVDNAISGTAALTLDSAGITLGLDHSNNYSGPTTLQQGTLVLRDTNVIASSPLQLYGGTLQLRSDTSATFMSAGTSIGTATIDVNRIGTTATGVALSLGPLSLSGQLSLTGGNGYSLQVNTLTMSSTYSTGGYLRPTTANLFISSVTSLAPSGKHSRLYLQGSATGSTISGVIDDGSAGGATSLYKSDSSTWTVSGNSGNTFSDGTSIAGGAGSVQDERLCPGYWRRHDWQRLQRREPVARRRTQPAVESVSGYQLLIRSGL